VSEQEAAARLLEVAQHELARSRLILSQAVVAANRATRRTWLAVFLLVLALGVMASHIVIYGW
jgi:hypothetical protein